MKRLQKVTMQDVANAAGVHRTTISLAFRQHPSLPVETRQRLLALADEMGYRPNPLVSALMTELRGKRSEKQHEIIAYVTTYPADNPWRRYPSLREMFAGAQARAATLGFAVQEFDLGAADMDGARLGKILRTRGIRGVLLAPLPEAPWPAFPLDLTPFAAVSLGISLQSPPLERVASDHYQCMRLAFHHCRQLGYERIGFFIGKHISARLEDRWLSAYLFEQHVQSGGIQPLLVEDGGHWLQDPRVEDWCRRERPDVILSPLGDNDWRELARLPGSPAVVNLTLPTKTQDCAGILQDTFKLGEIGIERLVSRLLHNDIGPLTRIQNTMLHGAWIMGASLPPRNVTNSLAS